MHWILKSLIAMVFVSPVPFLVVALRKTHGVSPEITSVWWFVGVSAAIAGWSFVSGATSPVFSWSAIVFAGGIGLVVGGVGNAFIFQAFNEAPNPGVPFAIVSANVVLVTIATKPLNTNWPHLFQGTQFSWLQVLGAVFVFVGICILKLAPSS